MLDVAIIGGGLAGLSLMQSLLAKGLAVELFEAAQRFGGRILSTSVTDGFACDLGPGWVWPDHQPRLERMITEEGLTIFPQWQEGRALFQSERFSAHPYMDRKTYAAARRIEGGAYQLVASLLQRLPVSQLHLEHRLLQVTDQGGLVELQFDVQGEQHTVLAKQVVLTIPPRLLVSTVNFVPQLATGFTQLLHDTPTWMAGHAKVVVRYPKAFWREAGYSGAALANYQGAMLAEVFDASSADGRTAALGGFFALPATLRAQYRDELEALLLEQLLRLFGEAAARPAFILIRDWYSEPLTATAEDAIPPQYHPQYGHHWLQQAHWNDKLYFGGSESAHRHGGYLEGALEAAERVARVLDL